MAARRRPRLLLFGWYREGTGFTRVLEALLEPLARRYDITWMGVGYKGEPRALAERVRLLPTNLEGGDLVGAYATRLNWSELRPDLILALNDIWYLEHYPREFGALTDRAPMYGYLPLDGDIPDPALVAGLTGFRRLFTYTQHAAGQLRAALRSQGIDTPVSVVGHGVDLEVFHPLHSGTDAAQARMELAREVFGLERPAWVVLNASRPDPRKRIDLSIEAFARFACGKPDNVRLCLHHAVSHERFVAPLLDRAEKLGVRDRILWWPPDGKPLDDAGLNRLYNACAAGLNTSHGEGFGLVSFEHAATGAPQLVPAHPPLRELWQDAALLISPVQPVRSEYSPLIMGAVDPGAVADALDALYTQPALYRRMSEAGVRRCRSPDLDWSTVAERLLDKLSTFNSR